MSELENLLLKNFETQINNCVMNTKHDFEEQKKNDPLCVRRFRFEKYIQDLNDILTNENFILNHLNIDLLDDCLNIYKEGLISLQKWYFYKTNIQEKENNKNEK